MYHCFKPRLLEGEPYLYNGIIWIVKGYQHPRDKIIGFPRYSLLDKTVVKNHWFPETVYWECLKMNIPVIDRDKAQPYCVKTRSFISVLIHMVEELLGIRGKYVLTGSILLDVDSVHDIDLVIYCVDDRVIEKIRELFVEKIFRPLNYMDLYLEYREKHVKDTDLYTYIFIKKNTILHFLLNNFHVNLRLVRFCRGYSGCIEPVISRETYTGSIEVLEPIYRYVVPSKYLVRLGDGREAYMESYRELFSEIPCGRYFVEKSFLEVRETGLYLVPDHGRFFKK